MDKNLAKLKEFLHLINESITKTEFVEAFSNVVTLVKRVEANNTKSVEDAVKVLGDAKDTMLKEIDDKNTRNFLGTKIKLTELFKKLHKEQSDGMNLIRDKVRNLKNGKDADSESIIEEVLEKLDIPEQKETILDSAEDIRAKLELLQDDDRLDISAIKGLVERLEKFEKNVISRASGGAASRVEGPGTMKYYDLSPSLDGVTKTFNLPAMYRLISVQSSSFPNAFRETVDYTWTPTSITFTSEIDASTTLANGQTINIIYAES